MLFEINGIIIIYLYIIIGLLSSRCLFVCVVSMATTRAPVRGPNVLRTTIILETSFVVKPVLNLMLLFFLHILVSINIFIFYCMYNV